MKKLFFSFLLFFIVPGVVHAVNYDIPNFSIQAHILENGDVSVQEIIVLDGNFNGYERDLSFLPLLNSKYETSMIYQGSNISQIQVKAKYINQYHDHLFQDVDFQVFEKTGYASNGDVAKYIQSSLSNGTRIRMYYPAHNQKVAFFIQYVIHDLVVVHSDFAELYFPFVGENFSDDIEKVDIQVYLPKSDSSSYFRVWAHGALSGEVKAINQNGLHAYASNVLSGEGIDVRMTFDRSLVPSASKMIEQPTFSKVLEIEAKKAEDANRLREELKNKRRFTIWSTWILYGSILGLWVFVYMKYGKSPKSGYYSKYNREFIEDYRVEVIDYLMNKKITPNAMSASIMNLIYKKNIRAEELPEVKKNKKDYLFTLENLEGINDSEEMLIEFLFDKVGKGKLNEENQKTFSTIQLKSYANGVNTCNTFIRSYTKWKNDILKKGKEQQFYEKHGTPGIIGGFLFLLSFALFSYGISIEIDFIPTYFLLLVGILFFIYSLLVDKKTLRGSEHYDKWSAFKNFLNDFGTFSLKELPEVVLWERYLVYATVFGLADKVQKSMNVHIQEFDTTYQYYPSFVYIHMGNTINNSINQAINSAYHRQAANYANTHSSSSSGGGFGGGFSGGSGFSGGGGGRGF